MISQPALGASVSLQLIGGIIPFKKTIAENVGRSALLRYIMLRPWVDDPGRIDSRLITAALINRLSLDVPRSAIAARHIDCEGLLRGVAQPVDLVWGEQDNLINARDIEYIASRLKIDRRLAIPACGHWPMLEYPQMLAEFINPEIVCTDKVG